MPGKIRVKRGAMVQAVWDRAKMVPYICERVSGGEFLQDVCADVKMTPSVFYRWLEEDSDEGKANSNAYARAKILQSHAIAKEIQDIADGKDKLSVDRQTAIEKLARRLVRSGRPGWQNEIRALENALIQRNKLQIDARKWYARALNKRDYGEKVDITSDDKALPAAPAKLEIEFVGADGQRVSPVMHPAPATPATEPGEIPGDAATDHDATEDAE